MRNNRLKSVRGYSILELVVAIVILGIISAVALKSIRNTSDQARIEETKKGLERLAFAIAGNPNLVSGGVRTDYGYVGDIGAMPPNLDALVTNPGGFAAWRGPYIRDDFSTGGLSSRYKMDAWGKPYVYSGGSTIASTGGGTLARNLANSVRELLYNRAGFVFTDLGDSPPGLDHRDSVRFILTYPDGAGSTVARTKYPTADGSVDFDSVPIGTHTLRVVYLPDGDTLTRKVNINPGQDFYADIRYFARLWTAAPTGGSGSEILRPTGAGATTGLTDQGCAVNWQCVDEATSDDDATYVTTGGTWRTDTYATQNHSLGSGTIDSVVIFINCFRQGGAAEGRTVLRTHGADYLGTTINLGSLTAYTEFSTAYAANPNTSSAWTWAEIDDMQVGVRLRNQGRCTQVWGKVYYRS
jgi:prepilin-type N-terminal cleavage/methylation domain-containing protein